MAAGIKTKNIPRFAVGLFIVNEMVTCKEQVVCNERRRNHICILPPIGY
jgi:hypothetical protein